LLIHDHDRRHVESVSLDVGVGPQRKCFESARQLAYPELSFLSVVHIILPVLVRRFRSLLLLKLALTQSDVSDAQRLVVVIDSIGHLGEH